MKNDKNIEIIKNTYGYRLKNKNGITLIALIITIIVLLILAGVIINLSMGKSGIINKSQVATEKFNKEAAVEKIDIKIAEAQMETYSTKGRSATLQDLADYFCDQDEIEYVLKQSKLVASLAKIDLSDAGSFFTKLKVYDYEFEIGSNLQINKIDAPIIPM